MDNIPGQRTAREMLSRAIESSRLASAYLFRGPAGVGKFAAALEFVRWLKCASPESCEGNCKSCRLVTKLNHPDIHILVPLPKAVSDNPGQVATVLIQIASDPFIELNFEKPSSIGIDEIRQLSERLALAPTSSGGRWTIIRDADLMTPQAANAFLKTLEEPPEDAHIILTSSRPEYLFPTIRSRTQPLRFTRLSRSEIEEILMSRGIEPEKARDYALSADGNVSVALGMADESSALIKELTEELWVTLFTDSDIKALDITDKLGYDRSLAGAVIDYTTGFLRDQLLILMGLGELIRNTENRNRIEKAAEKFGDINAISKAIRFLQERSVLLRFNPQYPLFWMDLIIRGRRIIAGGSADNEV